METKPFVHVTRRKADAPSSVVFRVLGVPYPQGNKTAFIRHGHAALREGKFTPDKDGLTGKDKLDAWRTAVVLAGVDRLSELGWPKPMVGPLAVCCVFWMPKGISIPKKRVAHATKPDSDKLLRSTFDGLSVGTGSGVIQDDATIVIPLGVKCYATADQPPGVTICVATPADMTAFYETMSLGFRAAGFA